MSFKITNLKKDLPNENHGRTGQANGFWGDWWEVRGNNLALAFGGANMADQRDPSDLAFTFQSGKGPIVISNFMPRGVTQELNKRKSENLALRTRMDFVSKVVFEPEHWDTKESRVRSALEWGGENEVIKNLMSQTSGDEGQEVEAASPSKPGLGEWIRLLARGLEGDIRDDNITPELRSNGIKILQEEIRRWSEIQRARGYQTFSERMLANDINRVMEFAYNMTSAPERDRKMVQLFTAPRQSRGPVLAVDEGRADLTKVEYGASEYMQTGEWDSAFRAYNARAMFSRLMSAKATLEISTTYPGRPVDVPEAFRKLFKNETRVAYKSSHVIPSENQKNVDRLYLYSVLDANGKEKAVAQLNSTDFLRFRLATNPKVTLPNGDSAVYKQARREAGGVIFYEYVKADGTVKSLDKDEQAKVLKANNRPNDPNNPVSQSVRGGIDDLFEKFFIRSTPERFDVKKPQDEFQVRELRDEVHASVLKDYKPIWLEIVNELNPEQKLEKVKAGMKILLKGLSVPDVSEKEKVAIDKIEETAAKQIKQHVEMKRKEAALIAFAEVSDPSQLTPNYSDWSHQNKYRHWERVITQTATNEGEKVEAMKAYYKKVSASNVVVTEGHVPEVASKQTMTAIIEDLKETVTLMTGGNPPEIKSLRDVTAYLDTVYLSDYVNTKVDTFKNHYSPDKKELPYISRRITATPLQYSVAANTRKLVTSADFITRVGKEDIAAAGSSSVRQVRADKPKANATVIPGLSEFGVKIFEATADAKLGAEENPILYEDIVGALDQRASGKREEAEVTQLLGKLSAEEAKLIIKQLKTVKPKTQTLAPDKNRGMDR